jgi:hypothetical protein
MKKVKDSKNKKGGAKSAPKPKPKSGGEKPKVEEKPKPTRCLDPLGCD